MRPTACMGGFCTQRDHCGAYQALYRLEPAERLCERGQERPIPVVARYMGLPRVRPARVEVIEYVAPRVPVVIAEPPPRVFELAWQRDRRRADQRAVVFR